MFTTRILASVALLVIIGVNFVFLLKKLSWREIM